MKKLFVMTMILLVCLEISATTDIGTLETKSTNEMKIILNTTIEKAWQALLYTLKEEALELQEIKPAEHKLETKYKIISKEEYSGSFDELMDSVFIKRETFMTGWDGSLAVWKYVRYKYGVELRLVTETQTEMRIIFEGGARETNTTNVWHKYSSSGNSEAALLESIKANIELIDKNSNIEIPEPKELLINLPISSSVQKKEIEGNPEIAFRIMQKILKDYSLTCEVKNKELGLLLTQRIKIENEPEEYVFTEKPIEEIEGFNETFALWNENYYFRLLVEIKPVKGEPDKTAIELRSYFERYERNTTNKWHTFRSREVIENNIVDTFIKALKNATDLDLYDFTNISIQKQTDHIYSNNYSTVLEAIMKTLNDMRYMVEKSFVDTMMILVTDYRMKDGKDISLQLALEPNEVETKVILKTSCKLNGQNENKGIIEYCENTESFGKELFNILDENLDKKIIHGASYISENIKNNFNQLINSERIDEILYLMERTGLLRGVELYPSKIDIIKEGNANKLLIPVQITEPLVSEEGLDQSCLINTFLQRIIFPYGMAITNAIKEDDVIEELEIKIAYKFLDLDDETPLDYLFREFRFITDMENVINNIKEKINVVELIENSKVYDNGKMLDKKNFRLMSSTY